jgi:DNA (cytosine-5)-methyltransferase 1
MITHYDLFAGIGGFSIALEEVFDAPVRHIFCEWESFPTAVLKQHWPEGEFWGDIAELVEHTNNTRLEGSHRSRLQRNGSGRTYGHNDFAIVTGGFPCQPFSHAGRRKGTADDRYQWPNMFAVIRNVQPEWVIAENVYGLATWNDGMVLETVCSDLEDQGYEVQPFIIPAVAVGAPHRRYRVWIIANRRHTGLQGRVSTAEGQQSIPRREPWSESPPQGCASSSNSSGQRRKSGRSTDGSQGTQIGHQGQRKDERSDIPDWKRDWREVAFATCNDAVDDGLSRLVDGVPYTRAKWRKHSLKAYGNGIVPQVAVEVMKAIKEANGLIEEKVIEV